mmetsp:Transcript_42172/g.48704  ORF Transcript_42172/g.48704 Transcript_42172/m.48704 type:complete len:354 (-) Transcript_42172:23-1084(-)
MFNFFSGEKSSEDAILECDYDKNATKLYEAIEMKDWISVYEFLETGRWSSMMILSYSDNLSPEKQTRTWITRFEPDGTVRWSQLPLHAAIIFGAPKRVMNALIQLYPLSIRCTDDRNMLPLHLAFRVGAEDNIVNLVLGSFPEGLFTKNDRGKYPYEVEASRPYEVAGPRMEFISSIQHIIESTSSMQQQMHAEKTAGLKDRMGVQKRHVATLECEKKKLGKKMTEVGIELAHYKKRCRKLEGEITQRRRIDTHYNATIIKNTTDGALKSIDDRKRNESTSYNRRRYTERSFPIQSDMRIDKETTSQILNEGQHSQSHFNERSSIYTSPTNMVIAIQDGDEQFHRLCASERDM